MKKIVALIPARGASKGIEKKNIALVNGKPLIYYSLQSAAFSEHIDEIWVSTEDDEIGFVSRKCFGTKVLKRPKELAQDDSTTESAMLHFARRVPFDIVVLLQCTSPLLAVRDLDKGIEAVLSGGYTSAFSTTKISQFIWKGCDKLRPVQSYYAFDIGKRPRRQDLDGTQVYRLETGGFYVTTREALLHSKSRISGGLKNIDVPYWESFEVDSPGDILMIERLMRGDKSIDL